MSDRTMYANLFRELAKRFNTLAEVQGHDFVSISEGLATSDEAGRAIIASYRAGCLKLDGLSDWIAWAEDGGNPPQGAEPRGAIDLARTPANVFIAVTGSGNLDIPSLLGESMMFRQAVRVNVESDSKRIIRAGEAHQRLAYYRDATVCQILAEMIEAKQTSDDSSNWITGNEETQEPMTVTLQFIVKKVGELNAVSQDSRVKKQQIANALGYKLDSLNKPLADLVRRGELRSTKGPTGGYWIPKNS